MVGRGRAAGAARVRSKMAEAVAFAKLHGAAVVDQALGTAAVAGRFADADLAAILTHQQRRPRGGPPTRAAEAHSLQPGTAGWAAFGTPTGCPVTVTATAKKPPVSVGPAVTGGPSTQALEQVVALTRRLRLPYLRAAALDVVPTARAQRWDPAELLRVLLTEEITGRDTATLRLRRRQANFPAGKTFHVWDDTRCSIPTATQQALRTLEWVDRRENLCVCGPPAPGRATSVKPSASWPSTPAAPSPGSASRNSAP